MNRPKTHRPAPSNPVDQLDTPPCLMPNDAEEETLGGRRRSGRKRHPPARLLMDSHLPNEILDESDASSLPPVLTRERSLDPPVSNIPSTSQVRRGRPPQVRASNNAKRQSAKKAPPSRKASMIQDTPRGKKKSVEEREESVESDKQSDVVNGVTYTVPPRKADLRCCFICEDDGVSSTSAEEVTTVEEVVDLVENSVDPTPIDTSRLAVKKEKPDANDEDLTRMNFRKWNVKREEPDEQEVPARFVADMDDADMHEEVVESMESTDAPPLVIQNETSDGNEDDGATEDIPRMTVKREAPESHQVVAVAPVDTRRLDVHGANARVQEKKSDDDYIRCGYRNCTRRMHKKCVEDYVCSEYSPMQAGLLFNIDDPVCPAHFCWHCYEERSKNASRFGEFVDCEECMRTFHLQCMPAGTKIASIMGKKKTFVCHYHAKSKPPRIEKSMRLKYCTECEELVDEYKPSAGMKSGKKKTPLQKAAESEEEDGDKRMECQGCTNVYHKRCGFREIKGPESKKYSNHGFCSYCVNGAVIVANQMVLAYCAKSFGLKAGNYPAMAVAVSDIPRDVVKRLPNLGKLGYIPVRWIWDGVDVPYFNVIHQSQVQRMTRNCEKNLPDTDFMAELKKCKNKFTAPTFPLDTAAMKKTIKIIDESVYAKGVKRILEKQELHECGCKPNIHGVKCDTSSCENRATNVECSETCDEKKGIKCANRSMQRREEKSVKKYEVKPAPNGKGLGVFATTTIKPLEFIFEYAGEIIDKEEHERREKRLSKLRSNDEWTYTMGLAKGLFVDARFKGGNSRFANHSCDPNAEVATVDIPIKLMKQDYAVYEPKLKVNARKMIVKGEEITFSYGLAKSRGLALDVCRCGAEKCIGKIGKKTKKDDKDDERFDASALMSDSEEEEVRSEDEDKENLKFKKTPKRKTPKKNEKSVERKIIVRTANKRRGSSIGASPSNPSKRRK